MLAAPATDVALGVLLSIPQPLKTPEVQFCSLAEGMELLLPAGTCHTHALSRELGNVFPAKPRSASENENEAESREREQPCEAACLVARGARDKFHFCN